MRFKALVRHRLQVLILVAVALLACAEQRGSEEVDRTATAEAGDRLSVYVVNYPLRYFAETCRLQINPAAKTRSGATRTWRCCTCGCHGWLTTDHSSAGFIRYRMAA